MAAFPFKPKFVKDGVNVSQTFASLKEAKEFITLTDSKILKGESVSALKAKKSPYGKYDLGFISDKDIFNHVKETVIKYRFNINLAEFNRNLIDPIKLTFDSKVYEKSVEEIIESEIIRQIDKSNTNHIGYFHQNIFRLIGTGWHVPTTGYDVVNDKKHIYVEMKNKHNTMNSSSSQRTYMRMQNTILGNPNATCYLVEVIAVNSQNIKWQISLDGQSVHHERIRRISMDKFYKLVTEDALAFKKLCEKLPKIIEDVVKENSIEPSTNSVVSELKKIDKNLMKSLYLMTFKKYEGFSNFSLN
jgi:hypothetical protein